MAVLSVRRSGRTQLAKRLETLDPGTPVFCGETRVGVVDGVYSEGASEVAEYMAVRWDARDGISVLIATREVETISERGVELLGAEPSTYETAPPYDPKHYPNFKRLH